MRKVIKILIASDVIHYAGFGLVAPIFAIFLKENLIGGSIVTAGIASAMYILIKSIAQLPIAKYIDKRTHKANLLILGSFIMALVPFLYIWSTHIAHIYCIQVLFGITSAMTYPPWLSLFSTNISKRKEGFEWSVYSTWVGLSTAAAAYFGAFVAYTFGFDVLFYIIGGLALLSALATCLLKKREIKKIENHSFEKMAHFFAGRKKSYKENR